MRKHKSVVAILLAVMMIFTFMPTMAFAAEEPVWDLQNHTVKYNGQTYSGVLVDFRADGKTVGYLPAEESPAGLGSTALYDLTGSEIYAINGAAVKSNYTLEQYKALDGKSVTLTLKKPSYATSGENKVDGVGLADSRITMTAKIVPLEKSTATQNGSISVEFTYSQGSGVDVKGTVAEKAVSVQGEAAIPGFVNEEGATVNAYYGRYDGKTHTFTANDVEGWTVVYKKFNSSTGNWDPILGANAIAVKDVADNGSYRAVYSKAGETDVNKDLTVGIQAVDRRDRFTFGFDSSVTGNTYTEVPADAQAIDFVVVNNLFEVDKEEAMKYFADAYEIVTTVNKADSSKVTWTFKAKDVKVEDMNKAYPGLAENYGLSTRNIVNASGTARVQFAATPVVEKADDITFSGVTTKSFKAKKKTKKLAKTKTFQVAAAADSGKVITFTGTSSNAKVSIDATGKVTVKKGLKKGAKVKLVVKAKTTEGEGYKAAVATQTYTIKIK